ncbi:tyrosine-type recombinase/integrase [Streptococcus equi]|uniref:tyrosine-type recombinase/integrase n=1 Tax=Streptococcus equi TaxID=1336 RepID=UPI00065893B5|nr:site-specific integrase [Streptococcus equi]CRT66299.1 integrase [Streptococcus equi subsp. equi]CRT77247.1 integrase [Streptococcus equi subsp. equi]
MKYNKTKYPNIFTYDTKKGKRYYVRRGYYLKGKKKEATKSNLKTLQEARAALTEIEQKIENNDFAYNKNLTVDQYWNMYVDNRLKTGSWKPDTEANKEAIYKTHFKKYLGKAKMKDISRIEYENHINGMRKNYSKNTLRLIHSVLNAMLNHAVTNKMLDDNPIDGITIGDSEIIPVNKRISLEEFKEWDSWAKKSLIQYDYTIVRMTYFGARSSEVVAIKIGNLTKLENGRYRILLDESRTYHRPNGGGMKTPGSERFMEVDLETSHYIDDVVVESKRIAKKYNRILSKEDYLFLTNFKNAKKELLGMPISIRRVYKLFNTVNEKSGMHVTPHMMRHFFATQGQIAGVPIEHMAAALGHSTSYMTSKYTHIKEEVAGSVTDRFMSALN